MNNGARSSANCAGSETEAVRTGFRNRRNRNRRRNNNNDDDDDDEEDNNSRGGDPLGRDNFIASFANGRTHRRLQSRSTGTYKDRIAERQAAALGDGTGATPVQIKIFEIFQDHFLDGR